MSVKNGVKKFELKKMVLLDK